MSQTQRNASRSRHRKGWRVALFFVAPFLLLYVLFLIYPAIQVAYLSLTNSDIAGQGRFIGLANYVELAHDGDFWASVWHTIYFIVLTVVPNTACRVFLRASRRSSEAPATAGAFGIFSAIRSTG